MFTCCLKKLLGLILSWSCSVYAGDITEEKLSSTILENSGVYLWLKQHVDPKDPKSISCRLVAKHPHEEAPQIFQIDCKSDGFEEELPGFVDHHRQKIRRENECKVGVVVVGSFDLEGLKTALADACEGFTKRSSPAETPSAAVSPSTDQAIYTSVSYATPIAQLKDDKDLKNVLVLYILQSIVEDRVKKAASDAGAEWIQPAQARSLLPLSYCTARSKVGAQQDPTKMLVAFLTTIKQIREFGFTDLELSNAKARLQKNMQAFYQTQPSNELLANYYSAHFGLGSGCPDYSNFMRYSFQMISEIERSDVEVAMPIYLKDASRRIVMNAPQNLQITDASIRGVVEGLSTDKVVLRQADKENLADKKDSYAQLLINEEERQKINRIIDTTANKNVFGLVSERKELLELGRQVQHVHPFKFLERVFTDPKLKKDMREIWTWILDSKKNGFMNGKDDVPGFGQKMTRENGRDNLRPYIVGFAKAVKADPDKIRGYVDRQQWEELVKYLIYLDNGI